MYEKIEETVFSMGHEGEEVYGVANGKKKLSEAIDETIKKYIN